MHNTRIMHKLALYTYCDKYIDLPTSLWYLSLSTIFPTSPLRRWLASIGESIGLQPNMTVSSKRSRLYFLWEIKIPLSDLATSIPRKCLNGPTSFISNSLASQALSQDISSTSLPITYMSSTSASASASAIRIVILPSPPLMNIVWSAWLCLYPNLNIALRNLSNQALSYCLNP